MCAADALSELVHSQLVRELVRISDAELGDTLVTDIYKPRACTKVRTHELGYIFCSRSSFLAACMLQRLSADAAGCLRTDFTSHSRHFNLTRP